MSSKQKQIDRDIVPKAVSLAADHILQQAQLTELRQKTHLIELDGIPKDFTRKKQNIGWYWGKYQGRKARIVRYIGAAGESPNETPESKLKEMTDPYDVDVRDNFTRAAYTDPTLAPSLENRNNSFYSDGFELELELKSNINPVTHRPMNPEEAKSVLDEQLGKFGPALQQLRDWTQNKDILLLEKMKASHIGCIVQGRAITMITPAISLLEQNRLPVSLTTLSTEEIKNPVIDTSRRKLVAVRVKLNNKKFSLPDEMIYCVRKHWGLRTDSLWYGASGIEAALQASKIYRRLINFDYAKAVVAGYLTKLLIKINTSGDETRQESQLNEVMSGLVDEGTDLVGVNPDVDIQPVKNQVDTAVVELATRKLEEILMSAGGSTMAQLGKTANLNRDTATIMEIAHKKYVRTPDEQLIAGFYENQLLNPLLKHLAGITIDQEGNESADLPVRVKIVRKTKVAEKAELTQDKDDSEITDTRLNEKGDELAKDQFKGTDVEDKDMGA